MVLLTHGHKVKFQTIELKLTLQRTILRRVIPIMHALCEIDEKAKIIIL